MFSDFKKSFELFMQLAIIALMIYAGYILANSLIPDIMKAILP